MTWKLSLSSRTATFSVCSLVLVVLVELWVFSLEHSRRIKALRLHLLIFIEIILFVCVRFIWKRVTYLVQSKSALSFGTLVKVVFAVVLAMAQVTMVFGAFWVQTNPPLLASVSNYCCGIVIFLTTTLVTADLLHFIVGKTVCRRRYSPKDTHEEKRQKHFEIKIRTLLALLCTIALMVSGTVVFNSLTIERVTVPIRGLSQKLNGTTIVQISDIHLGPFIGRAKLEGVIEKVNTLNGDLVVVTGDLVDSSVEALRGAVEPLKRVKSKYGAYYITGELLSQ